MGTCGRTPTVRMLQPLLSITTNPTVKSAQPLLLPSAHRGPYDSSPFRWLTWTGFPPKCHILNSMSRILLGPPTEREEEVTYVCPHQSLSPA